MFDPIHGSDGAFRPGLKALLFCLALIPTVVLFGLLTGGHPLAGLPMTAALLFTSWAFTTGEGETLASLGLRPGWRWLAHYGLGLALGAAVILGSLAPVLATGGVRLQVAGGTGALAAGVLAYLLPAANEELLFRGFVFQRLEQSLTPWPALLVTSVWFAAAHLGNPGMAGVIRAMALLNIFLAGLLLGLAYQATRSLALSMGLHLGWNWTQGALLGFGVSGTGARGLLRPELSRQPDWWTGAAFGLEGSLALSLVCAVFCAGFIWWLNSAKTRRNVK